MTVKKLIGILKQYKPEADVQIWCNTHDLMEEVDQIAVWPDMLVIEGKAE